MFRLITYLLITIFLITIIRNVMGLILRAFANSFQPAQTAQKSAGPAPEPVPLSGELKKDPVCGTYTSAATSIQQTVGGQTFYFCSPQCRDQFRKTA